MVRTQASLADELGIDRWYSIVGGSMGGMQALEWAVMYPDRVGSLVLASSTAQASAQQIAWSHIGRSAIAADPGVLGGDYYDRAPGEGPHAGLAVARMTAQVTYRSDEVFNHRFDRGLLGPLEFSLDPVFDVEGYLDYHGEKLARRFDANSYIRLNRAMDLHDVGRGRGGVEQALSRVAPRRSSLRCAAMGCIRRISSDVCTTSFEQVGRRARGSTSTRRTDMTDS